MIENVPHQKETRSSQNVSAYQRTTSNTCPFSITYTHPVQLFPRSNRHRLKIGPLIHARTYPTNPPPQKHTRVSKPDFLFPVAPHDCQWTRCRVSRCRRFRYTIIAGSDYRAVLRWGQPRQQLRSLNEDFLDEHASHFCCCRCSYRKTWHPFP